MSLRKVLITTACLTLVGCTGVLEPRGGGPGPGPGGPDGGPLPDGAVGETPQARFLNTVRDPLNLTCTPCHVAGGTEPTFLTVSADDYYDSIMVDYPSSLVGTTPQDSRIYAKGLTPHAGGVVWSADQQAAVSAWIEDEYEVRSNQGGVQTPVPDPEPQDDCGGLQPSACALQKFGECFTAANWNNYSIAQVANTQSAQGACYNCHDDGTGGFYASTDPQEMYTRWKTTPYVQKLVDATIDNTGAFTGLIKTYRINDKGGEPGHPSYQLVDTNVDDFVDATIQLFQAGGCVDEPNI